MTNVMVMKEIKSMTLRLGVDLSTLDLDSIRLPLDKTCGIVRTITVERLRNDLLKITERSYEGLSEWFVGTERSPKVNTKRAQKALVEASTKRSARAYTE
ncbi:hypothetical protein LR48_Vigan08g040400 [Vigna angularis]|uniref:Uncharacterized protein n=1 Tax=Phaseolus angularis TaxID=3914 RepID=A0A0L9V3T5_PHAAN|nr:hypothetical protein LR48_Vigan08g040400 [Vigna angularis]